MINTGKNAHTLIASAAPERYRPMAPTNDGARICIHL